MISKLQVFAALKDLKSASASSSVVDNFAFLEFLATNVSKGNPGGSSEKNSTSPNAKYIAPAPGHLAASATAPGALGNVSNLSTEQSINNIGAAIANRKQLRRTKEPPGGQLPAMNSQSAQSHPFEHQGLQGRQQQQELSQQRSLPLLGAQHHSHNGGVENRYSRNYANEVDDIPYRRLVPISCYCLL